MKKPMNHAAAKALHKSVQRFVESAQDDLNAVVSMAAFERDEAIKVYHRYSLRHARSQLRLAAARIDRALRRHGDTSL